MKCYWVEEKFVNFAFDAFVHFSIVHARALLLRFFVRVSQTQAVVEVQRFLHIFNQWPVCGE